MEAELILTDKLNRILSVEAFLKVMDFSYNGIYVIDAQERVVYINDWASEYLGIPKNSILGHKVGDFFPRSNLANVLKTREIDARKIRRIHDKVLMVTRIPIEANGESIGAVALFQDVNRIIENELHIRKKLIEKGLVATYTFNDIICESKLMEDVIELAKLYAREESSILIHGPSGAGKELFAQSIHNYSDRRDAPFLAINCGALPESILEAELFGYAEASFTGAQKGGKAGVFQQAHKGTLFLDEIAEISLSVQTKLLRVLQEKTVRPVGGDRNIPVDVRIICATNKNLMEEINEKRFRLDLFFRLNVLNIFIPPLRERPDDIARLALHILTHRLGRDTLSKHNRLILRVIDRLKQYDFPGNVRELKNIMERFELLLKNGIFLEDVDLLMNRLVTDISPEKPARGEPLEQVLSDREKERLLRALIQTDGSRAKAAKLLGISPSTVWRRMKKYGVRTR